MLKKIKTPLALSLTLSKSTSPVNLSFTLLIPTSIIAIRVAHNSTNPVIIVVPILIASLASVLTAIFLVKLKCKRDKIRGGK